MRLSDPAYKLFSDFFSDCELCEGAPFPNVQVYARRGSWLVTNLLMVDGITIGRHVFINPKLVSRDRRNLLTISKTLMAHELVHVIQYQRLGFWKFLSVYVRDFWKIFKKKKKWNLRSWFESYLEVPHEVEAREIASDFSRWLTENKKG